VIAAIFFIDAVDLAGDDNVLPFAKVLLERSFEEVSSYKFPFFFDLWQVGSLGGEVLLAVKPLENLVGLPIPLTLFLEVGETPFPSPGGLLFPHPVFFEQGGKLLLASLCLREMEKDVKDDMEKLSKDKLFAVAGFHLNPFNLLFVGVSAGVMVEILKVVLFGTFEIETD
jgi:hypothetical protein